ncbi:TetR/AcrR family transcriptional regulator [Suilimivivens sp.]|uniref:TetR/AcrR family transcriptional regulator n=1 Tax=Suilimivivens sp. TaxID=2981669 RepID=UPI003076D818
MNQNDRENSKELIIRAGKQEFLKYGYKGASLRNICKQAGVTTGAFYFQFENKEQLLDEILRPVITYFSAMIQKSTMEEFEGESSSADGDEQMLEMLWNYKEECQILLEGTAGTAYEKVFEELQEGLRQGFLLFFGKYGISDVDEKLLDVIVRMRVESYLTIIRKEYTLEETKKLARQIGIYCDAGFEALVRQLKTEHSGN